MKKIGVESDGKISVPEERMDEFKESLSELFSTEVEHSFMKLKPEEVDEITDGVNISCNEMNLFISYLVEDDSLVKALSTPIEGATESETKESEETSEKEEEPSKD